MTADDGRPPLLDVVAEYHATAAIVEAARAWYRGTQSKVLHEAERGRLYAALKAACKADEEATP